VTVVLPRSDASWDARPARLDADLRVPEPDVERLDRIRHRVIVFVASAIVIVGAVAALFGERGFLDVRRSRAELQDLRREVKDEVRRLEEDPAAVERIAREELGFAPEGEIQILLPRKEEQEEEEKEE
jgi:cell division protein FtsB